MSTQLLARPDEPTEARTGHIGRIVVASIVTGLVVALTLVLFVVPAAAEPVVALP